MNADNRATEDIIRRGIQTLQAYAAAWRRDKIASQDGWRIYYALDTDVVRMYLNPNRVPSYGRVFNESDEISGYLANLLGDFLFHSDIQNRESPPPSSYLIIPPHDEELRTIMQAIARDAERTLREGQQQYQRLSEIFSAYGQKTPETLAAELQSSAAELIRLSNDLRDCLTAQGRFASLDPGKLNNIWNERVHGNQYLIDQTEAEVWSSLQDQRSKWYERLREHRPLRRERDVDRWDTAENDAQVLALIDYLNDKLAEKRTKIVLITGSPSVFSAGRGYIPPGRYNTDGTATFSELCLRHPQWIMANRRFFDPIEAKASLGQWLDILCPDVRSAEQQAVVGTIERKEMGKLPEQWSNLVGLLATTKYGSQSVADTIGKTSSQPLVEGLAQLVESRGLTPERFRALFERPVTDSLSRLYLSSTWIGLLDSVTMIDKQAKMMPALHFDEEFDVYNGYYTELLALFEEGTDLAARGERATKIKKLNEKINSDGGPDSSLYHSHVIHAAVYAAKGLWEPAITLCNIATRIADELKKGNPTELRRGREAAYLAAVVRRRSAMRIGDLREAERFLLDARRRENPPTMGTVPREDVRFKSEEIAIEIRKIYFRHFVENRGGSTASILPEIRSVLMRLQEIIREVKGLSYGAVKTEWSLDATKNWVLRQCYTNLFDLLLILLNEGDSQIYRDENIRFFREFRETIRQEDEHRDPHAWLVSRIAGMILFPEDTRMNPEPRQEIISRINAIPLIARYDEGRRDVFAKLVGAASS
ncbi:MAG: hypothetical protein WBM14_06930 [Terracidiphilus sp.]|jgi:hypothetical protein